ncbi:MAG: 3-dehydroquinate synthase [Candidatus Anstonellaceae archaeon]
MRKMSLETASGKCEIAIGESIARLEDYCNGGKLAIVTDGNVLRLHGASFPKCSVIEIGTGEESKTLATAEKIYEKLLEIGFERGDMLVGIGGGIACDVAGFAASTYLRGVRFGFVPTTLLAQVDAAVGGKNGVNLHGYKNLVGTIRQPEFVLCDLELLKTLPQRELRCGFAEVIKSAAIGDAQLFSYLEQHLQQCMELQRTAIEKAVHDSLAVKIAIVGKDEGEKEERRKLNFGHTLGHAIEKSVKGVPHGEAVAIGMAAAAKISAARGKLQGREAERLVGLLEKAGLPTRMELEISAVMDAIGKDKKREAGKINFVLLEGIGKAVVEKVFVEELEAVLREK